jgi:biopolymer transport protein ExbB
MNILLQIQEAPQEFELTIFDLLMKGGVIMIPIFLLLLIATYFSIERYLFLHQVTKRKPEFIPTIRKHLQDGDIKAATLYADHETSATGKVISTGLQFVGKPYKEIESVMESSANIQIAHMEANLGYLGIIAGVAPMLGFIGTITGIIRIFYTISLADNISIGIIAGGLYEKMITSGSGLVVGVISFIAYHLLHQKIQKFALGIQEDTLEFLRVINTK